MNRGLATVIGLGVLLLLALDVVVLLGKPGKPGVPSVTPTAEQLSPTPTTYAIGSPTPSESVVVAQSPTFAPSQTPAQSPSPFPSPVVSPTEATAMTGPPMPAPTLFALGCFMLLLSAALFRTLKSKV